MNLLGFSVDPEDLFLEAKNPLSFEDLLETSLLLAALGDQVKAALEAAKERIRKEARSKGETTFEVPSVGTVQVTFPGQSPKLRKGADMERVLRTLPEREFASLFQTVYVPTEETLRSKEPVRSLLLKYAVEFDEGTPRVSLKYCEE